MQRSMTAIVLTGVLVLPLVTARLSLAEPGDIPKNDETELKALQKELIATLTRAVDFLSRLYSAGAVDFNRIVEAEHALLNAKLDSVQSPAERITILEEQLKLAEGIQTVAERRFQEGAANEYDTLRAKAWCLDIKIKLLRERGKFKPQKR